ncbi:MAG: imidazole glycerol phosphate synthase subunit HisH [Chloroflexi bacterium]|nr:imidazole glycerol phosphate synthase subunit HisH [Chloroflexota bacterium]
MDYGLGNLYSVKQACEHVGLGAAITSSKQEILCSDAVILPGVGAFGDAMASLRRLDLTGVIRDIALSAKPLLGICLGMQLLMTESCEFGRHQGLGIITGTVERLQSSDKGGRRLKVPQVGWNHIWRVREWTGTPLGGLGDGDFMYFVHSYYVSPADTGMILSVSRYGVTQFCSSLQRRNIFACQFHPERSGQPALRIYHNLKALLEKAVS